MPRSRRAVRAGSCGPASRSIAMPGCRRSVRFEGEGPATSPLRIRVPSRCTATIRNPRGAFPGAGLRPWITTRQVVAWSGNRTRDTRITSPMLYPTELSSGGRTGFEPATNGLRRCSAIELSSARGTPSPDPRHAPRQRRAHRAGRASARNLRRCVRAMFRIGASGGSPKAPIRVRCIAPAARAEASRHGALLRLRGFPCLGPACPDASGARCTRV